MQQLEILIEENALGSVRSVMVAANAPVAGLITALVEELKLPQTDLFGKRLAYMLQQSGSGRLIPNQSTLIAAGVQSGARLALIPYTSDDVAASAIYPTQARQSSVGLHSSATLADADIAVSLPLDPPSLVQRQHTSAIHTPLAASTSKSRAWTRRAFFLAAGATLGIGGVGVGYAAYTRFLRTTSGAAHNVKSQAFSPPQLHGRAAPTPTPAKPTQTAPVLPTRAQAVLTFTHHQQTVRTVAWSPDGMFLASGSDDMRVLIWDGNGTIHQTLQHPGSVRALAWSPDAQRLVTGANNEVTFFAVQQGMRQAQFAHAQTQLITGLAWATQGQMRVASSSQDKTVVVWNTNGTYQIQTVYQRHTVPVEAVAWSADGESVASSSQGGLVRVWNATNGQDLHGYFQDAQIPMRALAFMPGGAQLAVGGDDGIVRLWNGLLCVNAGVKCLDIPQRLQVAQKPVRALAWSPDGHLLAVGAEDGNFTVWAPAQSQKPLLTMQQNAIVHAVTWSANSKQLATASGNGVTLWQLM